jgi:hypothetical protein
MKLVYDLGRGGYPGVHASPGDEVVASYLQSSLPNARSVQQTRQWLLEHVAVDGEHTYSFNGYALEVAGGTVIISSFYDQFPDTAYPYEEFDAALADYEAWLRSQDIPLGDSS